MTPRWTSWSGTLAVDDVEASAVVRAALGKRRNGTFCALAVAPEVRLTKDGAEVVGLGAPQGPGLCRSRPESRGHPASRPVVRLFSARDAWARGRLRTNRDDGSGRD